MSGDTRIAGENLKMGADDLIVNYDDNGPVYAPVVLFVHGTPFNKSIWDLQVEALKSNCRVISYDLRGHGNTKGPAANLSVESLRKDLLLFMDHLDIDKAILCGHSLGAYVALDAVDHQADRFNAVVLSGVQCMEDDDQLKERRRELAAMVRSGDKTRFSDELTRLLFASTSFVTRKEEVRAVRAMIDATAEQTVLAGIEAHCARRESCSNLWSLNLPVLLLSGREDELTPPMGARFMRDNISGSQLHEIEYAGHLANLENTHEFNQALRAFIERVCQNKHLSRHCSEETVRVRRSFAGK